MPGTFLIVGLGNPGEEYERSRHNIGYMVVDLLAQQLGLALSRDSHHALWTSAPFGEDVVVIAKPTTFMNESGRSVKSLLSDLEVEPGSMIVVHDDIDLPLGQVRVKRGGSSGGHRGVESIVRSLGSEDFIRTRVGIGRPPGRQDPAEYVLREFSKKELAEVEFALTSAAQAVISVLERGVEAAMNEYNVYGRPPRACWRSACALAAAASLRSWSNCLVLAFRDSGLADSTPPRCQSLSFRLRDPSPSARPPPCSRRTCPRPNHFARSETVDPSPEA